MRRVGGKYIAGMLLVVILMVAGVLILRRESQDQLDVIVGQRKVRFLVADSAPERYQGLSGKTVEDFAGVQGMAFVFTEPAERTFSMRDMRFDLDFVWVLHGEVMKVDASIPAPAEGEKPYILASTPYQADLVLELPAGQAESLGFRPGVRIEGR